MKNEFNDFLSQSDVVVPPSLKQTTYQKIQSYLNPDSKLIFLKIFSIHAVVGFLSLGICHQFGLNPFNTEKSLADWFMSTGGHHFCMVACGALFITLSLLAAQLALTVEEIRVFKKTEILQTATISLFSLALLWFFGAELVLSMALLWLAGAFAGGLLISRGFYKVRLLA